MSLEHELRQTLRDRAQTPAPHPDLLEAVSAGARRHSRRRATLLASAAAVVVAATALPALIVNGYPSAPQPATASHPTPGLSSAAATWRTDWWVPPVFPMQPSWLPSGVKNPTVQKLGPNVALNYEQAGPLRVEIGPLAPGWEVEGEEDHDTTIGDRRAVVRTATTYDSARKGDRYVGVRWKMADGRLAQVLSFGRLTEQEVLRFARGLRVGAVRADRLPIAVAAVPPGLTMQYLGDHFVCFAPPPLTATARYVRGLCAGEEKGTFESEPGDEHLTVAGRPAVINSTGTSIKVPLSGSRSLVISVEPDDVPLSRDDLIRFAEGVRVAGE